MKGKLVTKTKGEDPIRIYDDDGHLIAVKDAPNTTGVPGSRNTDTRQDMTGR